MILEATELFWYNVVVWFLSEYIERDYWYRLLHPLEWKLRTAGTFLSSHGTKCFNSFYKSLHRSFVTVRLWIIFPYFRCFVSLMFDNRLICFIKKPLVRCPPTRCSLNVDRLLINGLNIIMASSINAAKGHYNGPQINREKNPSKYEIETLTERK